jgi:hypothetical protein
VITLGTFIGCGWNLTSEARSGVLPSMQMRRRRPSATKHGAKKERLAGAALWLFGGDSY